MPHRSFPRLVGILATLWFLLNLPLLLGIRVLPSDAMFEFYPMMYFNVHAIREGLAPWWNPLIFGGYPQIADPQAMLFAPLMMAWMLLRADPSMPWFVVGALLHVLMGGVAVLALSRRFRATDFGALIAALVFMGGGVAASRIQYVPILVAYSFIPVAVVCLLRFADRPGWARAGVLGLCAGCILVEPVQLTYLVGLVLPVYALVVGARRWSGWLARQRFLYVGGLLIAVLIAAAMAVPQLLFSYAFVAVSNRPELPLEAATSMSVSWSTLLTLLLPNALHSLRGTYAGPVDPIETFYWIGALPSVLLIAGLRRAWSVPEQRRQLQFFGLVAVLAILYMVGGHTPFYGWLYELLPGVRQFRRPSDAAYLVNFGLALAAGFAASHVDLTERRPRVLVLGFTTLWLLLASASMVGTPDKWQVATVLAPIAAGAAAWRARRFVTPSTAMWMLVVVVVVDYRCFGLNGEFNQRGDNAKKFKADPASAALAARIDEGHEGIPVRSEAFGLAAGWKNNVVLRGIPATHGYGPLRWALWDRWYGAYSDGDGPRPTSPYNPNPGSTLNQLLSVAYVVMPAGTSTSGWQNAPGREVFHDERTSIVELTDHAPRLLTPRVASLSSSAPTPDVFNATDFRQVVLLSPRIPDEAEALSAAVAACPGHVDEVSNIESSNVSVSASVRGTTNGWLVVTDQDFPGWRATIDGIAAPTWRADGIVRAVCVPAGEHEVRFTFHPWAMVRDVLQDKMRWN